jgi:deoxyribodipyrimidine photo-lyase
MIIRGKMHGWARMYWAKKILEWSSSPRRLLTAPFPERPYELDGGTRTASRAISWAIGGLHDRPWPNGPYLGRYAT